MMPFSQSHCGVFNDIYRRSLKTGKRFSIANNKKKKKKRLKEHEIKTGTKKKKSEKQNLTEQRKTKFL